MRSCTTPALTALARKIHYRVDPANPYPQRFTGHLRVLLKDGREIVERQDYFRGGAENPLSDVAIEQEVLRELRLRRHAARRRPRHWRAPLARCSARRP